MRVARVPARAASVAAGALAASLPAACPGTASGGWTFHCSPSQPSVHRSFDYGTTLLRVSLPPHGHLIAGRLPGGGSMAEIRPDGSIRAKIGWWRGLPARLVISGRRLDAKAAPLRADLPSSNSYGVPGLYPSELVFPTTGCWRVSAKLGRAHLSFTLLVTKVRH